MKYEFGPLSEYIARRWPHVGISDRHDKDRISLGEFLHMPSMTERQVLERAKINGLSTELADRIAICIGVLPSDIWPSWFFDAADEPFCAWCGEPLPLDSNHLRLYCGEEHYSLGVSERERDVRRLAKHWRRVDAISARVQGMTEIQLKVFLGIVDDPQLIALAA